MVPKLIAIHERMIDLTRKNWSIEEDIVAFYLYRFGDDDYKQVSELLGRDSGSLRMRIGNFKAIEGQSGLSNYAKQSLNVYTKYKNIPQNEFQELFIKIISK